MKKILFFVVLNFVAINGLFSQTTNLNNCISGTILDVRNSPIAQASIVINGKNISTTSDSHGKFKFCFSLNDTIVISAVGYNKKFATFKSYKTPVDILLTDKLNKFDSVSVSTQIKTNKSEVLTQIQQNNISHGLEDFKTSQNLNYGTSYSSGIRSTSTGKMEAFHSISDKPTGTFYNGASIPIFTSKDDTKGSRYLLASWSKGAIISQDGSKLQNDNWQFNFDKIDNHLLLLKNSASVIELDDNVINSFSLNSNGTDFNFEKIPLLNNRFFQVILSSESKLKLIRSVKTKFVKANYVTTGLTESGNNYDEYVDEFTYYVYFPSLKSFKSFELRKKSIKQVFIDYKDQVNEYFGKNSDADINETFIKGLVESLNKL